MSWSSIAAGMEFGKIVARDGWSYVFTDVDLPWAVRYVVGEIGEYGDTAEAWTILWTMANRLYQTRPAYSTYAAMVKAYSIALHGDPREVPRRAWVQSLTAEETPPETMNRVVRFLEGRVEPGIAVGLVHQGSCAAHPTHGTPDYKGPSGECYWKVAATRSWTADTLRPVPGSGSSGGTGGPLVVGLVGLAGAIGVALKSK